MLLCLFDFIKVCCLLLRTLLMFVSPPLQLICKSLQVSQRCKKVSKRELLISMNNTNKSLLPILTVTYFRGSSCIKLIQIAYRVDTELK